MRTSARLQTFRTPHSKRDVAQEPLALMRIKRPRLSTKLPGISDFFWAPPMPLYQMDVCPLFGGFQGQQMREPKSAVRMQGLGLSPVFWGLRVEDVGG